MSVMTNPHGLLAAVSGLACALALAACGAQSSPAAAPEQSATVSITDAQDRTVEVPANPETVVVTDWSVIRTLTGLGVEVDAVPTPNGTLPADLQQYAADEVTKIGSLFELDYEKINELEPDLVIVGSRSGTPEVVAELTKITPNVIDMSARFEQPEEQVATTEERVLQLGTIFDKEAEATEQMTEVKDDIAAANEQAGQTETTAMVVQVSGGKASAYGPSSRFGIVYADSGFGFADTGAPIDDEGSHGEEVTSEFFTRYNPGTVFVLDRGKVVGEEGAPALEVLNNDLVNATDAAENDKLVEIDGFSWYLAPAAPASLQQMVTDVNAAF
jgi:iron complex transport system substrate-binding protein